MRLKEYAGNSDGKRAWLTPNELDRLYSVYEDCDALEKECAARLMGMCGLRTKEAIAATPADVRTTESGQHKLKVIDGKGADDEPTYRETYLPESLYTLLRALKSRDGLEEDEPYIDRNRTTIQRWVKRAKEHLAAETGDDDWLEVGCHDLRRSWCMSLLNQNVPATMVMELGGWKNYETFRDHYMDEYDDKSIEAAVSGVF